MKLRRAILMELHNVWPRVCPEDELLIWVNARTAKAITTREMRDELDSLQEFGYVIGVRSQLDDVMKWTITDSGKAALIGGA